MTKFDISIGSVPHREELVADIFYENQHFAEISEDTGKMIIEVYPDLKKDYWEFNFDEFIEALNKAKKRLSDMGGKRN